MVEFALLAPILIAILLGILGFGQYILTAHTLQQLANDAARASIAGINRGERDALARDSVARGLTRSAVARPEQVSTSVDEAEGRIVVTVAVDSRTLLLLRPGLVPMPDPVIKRRGIAGVAAIP